MPSAAKQPAFPACRWSAQRTGATPGFTLLELMLALAVNCVVFTAVGVLVYGGVRADSYLQSCNTTQAEVELAMRRMSNNLRTAQTGSITLGTGTFTTLTAPDTAHGYPNGATVVYSLVSDPLHSGQKLLNENDPRYGSTNTLAHNVTTFNIALVTGFVDLYQVDLVTGTAPVVERHFRVQNRN